MTVLFLAFFVIILSTASSLASLSPEDHVRFDAGRNVLEECNISSQAEVCNESSDCPENQYCHSSPLSAVCWKCKENEMNCRQDEECCSGNLCSWGRCTKGLVSGRTRCDPSEEHCAPGFCCFKTQTYPFPVCIPLPSEGEQCNSSSRSLLNVIIYGEDYGATLKYCPCAEGLVCSSRGNYISTCEKPDDIMDFTNYRDDSLLQPVVRHEAELTYYDADLVPLPGQDNHLAFVDFPRAAEEVESNTGQLNVGINDNLEEENLQLYDHDDKPSSVDFQELKRLASEMGQYFGASFY
ncbi:dickkopf-related protein 3-like [Mantella aurantiaca]